MKRFAIFLTGFVTGCIRFWPLLPVCMVLVFIGLAWSDICTYVGLGILGLYLILSLIYGLMMNRFTKLLVDNPEMDDLMRRLQEETEKHAKLHGEDLLPLSNEELCEAVYEQNNVICEKAEETEQQLELFSGARRTVFIVSTFDAEVQNGGLCQFFVNSSRCTAPYVSEALSAIGADTHRKLYDEFIHRNRIDVHDLDSFRIFSIRGYKKQTKRYDFEAFDDRYYELDPLEDLIANYIRAHVTEF